MDRPRAARVEIGRVTAALAFHVLGGHLCGYATLPVGRVPRTPPRALRPVLRLLIRVVLKGTGRLDNPLAKEALDGSDSVLVEDRTLLGIEPCERRTADTALPEGLTRLSLSALLERRVRRVERVDGRKGNHETGLGVVALAEEVAAARALFLFRLRKAAAPHGLAAEGAARMRARSARQPHGRPTPRYHRPERKRPHGAQRPEHPVVCVLRHARPYPLFRLIHQPAAASAPTTPSVRSAPSAPFSAFAAAAAAASSFWKLPAPIDWASAMPITTGPPGL